MKSSSKRPTSFSAKAVATAVFKPKQRRSPRATLYSPPPSQTLNSRAVRIRLSPGSRRSMISPRAIMSHRHEPAGLMFKEGMCDLSRKIGRTRRKSERHGARPALSARTMMKERGNVTAKERNDSFGGMTHFPLPSDGRGTLFRASQGLGVTTVPRQQKRNLLSLISAPLE